MKRFVRFFGVAAAVALITAPIHAAELAWQGSGVSGDLLLNNYTDGTNTNLAPTSEDILDIGGNGSVTYSTPGLLNIQKFRVGHGQNPPGNAGVGTVTINGGASLNLTVGAAGAANASLWVGNIQNGTLNIDGDGTSVTSTQVIEVGYGNNLNRSGTVNITNGASLTALAGNVNVGDRTSGVGLPGHINLSGSNSLFNVTGAGADLNIGVWAPSTYDQTGGTATITDQIVVGQRNADGSTFKVSGGTLTAGGSFVAANATTADGSSENVAVTFNGNATINLGSTMLIGSNDAINASLAIGGNAIVNMGANITVGSGAAQGSSMTVSDNAIINIPGAAAAGNIFIGRGTTSNTTFNMTGGTITLGNHFLMGTAASPGATGIVGNHSGGSITTTNNFTIGDTWGASTYNISDTATINVGGWMIAGRQRTTGAIVQTGGDVTAGLGIAVGRAENADTATWGTGTYNVSGGTITANQSVNSTALWIGSQGNGTFRVIGDDATININGNAIVNAGGGAQGTLAYQLETGDLLSVINVTGTATFASGAILAFDTSLASPTQTTYDLLTATSIVDGGITKNFPAGWDYQIINVDSGQILQAVQGLAPSLLGDFNNDGKVDAGDYATWRKNDAANATLPNDNGAADQAARFTLWRANFGNPPGAGASLEGAQVPEPASLAVVLIGVATLVGSRRRS